MAAKFQRGAARPSGQAAPIPQQQQQRQRQRPQRQHEQEQTEVQEEEQEQKQSGGGRGRGRKGINPEDLPYPDFDETSHFDDCPTFSRQEAVKVFCGDEGGWYCFGKCNVFCDIIAK